MKLRSLKETTKTVYFRVNCWPKRGYYFWSFINSNLSIGTIEFAKWGRREWVENRGVIYRKTHSRARTSLLRGRFQGLHTHGWSIHCPLEIAFVLSPKIMRPFHVLLGFVEASDDEMSRTEDRRRLAIRGRPCFFGELEGSGKSISLVEDVLGFSKQLWAKQEYWAHRVQKRGGGERNHMEEQPHSSSVAALAVYMNHGLVHQAFWYISRGLWDASSAVQRRCK
jgi:hypothetical protein